MHRLATIHNVTDDRQTQQCSTSATVIQSAKIEEITKRIFQRIKLILWNVSNTEYSAAYKALYKYKSDAVS